MPMEFPRFDLTGRVALVTGAARGLGRAISLAFAHAGADVALGLREVNSHGGLVAEIASMGRRALPLQMEVARLDQIFRAVDQTVAHFGRLDIPVNAVAPTFIHTPGTESALANPEFRSDVIERIAGLHRIGEPMDVAGAVVFLASPAASLITGDTILIDGGWTAR